MIIKSLGRKARTHAYGKHGERTPNVFRALAAYMNRGLAGEEGRAILWHNFPGGEEMTEDALVAEFEKNAKRLRDRKNGNALYHEILSFSAGHSLDPNRLARDIADVGQEYLRQRAPEQLAYGVIHLDTDHIHLHLMISANRVRSADRVRLSKSDFADIQRQVEQYLLAKYPELAQTKIYSRDDLERAKARAEKSKTQVHEQAMKVRTGEPSRKDTLKMRLHHLFERARSVEELHRMAETEGLSFYQRGKNVGVIEQDAEGKPIKHRLATLGVDDHYRTALERFARHHDTKTAQSRTEREATVEPKVIKPTPTPMPSEVLKSMQDTARDIGSPEPPSRAKEVLDEELRFGKEVVKDFIFGTDRTDRQPNHEKPPEIETERRLRILREAKDRRIARENDRSKDQGKDRGEDQERWTQSEAILLPHHVFEAITDRTSLILENASLLFHFHDMNSKQAKSIPLPEFLSKLGFEPAHVRWVDHWYLSPFRGEHTPSFKIDASKNVWYDHGIGQGGTIIDLAQLMRQTADVSHALSMIADTMGAYTPSLTPTFEKARTTQTRETKPKSELVSIRPIETASLERYLQGRAIPIDLARLYFEEAEYRVGEGIDAKTYRALAFANDSWGYELRSPSFKGTLGKKDIRFLPSLTERPDAVVFEGAMDFVSALAHYKKERSSSNVLVLNSTSLVERGMQRLKGQSLNTALTYFDHDEAWRLATERFEKEGADHGIQIVRDMSRVYEGYGDFNEFFAKNARSASKMRVRGEERDR